MWYKTFKNLNQIVTTVKLVLRVNLNMVSSILRRGYGMVKVVVLWKLIVVSVQICLGFIKPIGYSTTDYIEIKIQREQEMKICLLNNMKFMLNNSKATFALSIILVINGI